MEGYSNHEIAPAEGNDFLDVNVSWNIVGFLEVDEIGQTLKVVLEMKRTWFDSRLTLLHLQQDIDLNYIWPQNHKRIWYPKILFENIDPSKNHDDRLLLYTIERDLNHPPIVQNPGSTNGTNTFKGSEHKIVRTQKYTYFWRCVYGMRWFPFDRQTCKMWMRTPKHYQDFVRLHPEKIEYQGNKDELTEYTVDNIAFCSQKDGKRLVFEVALSRPLISSVLTIYIPTSLLLVIRF